MYYIYEIRNQVYQKYYIGMTFDYDRRISQHKSMLKAGKHPCKEMQKDYNYLINKRLWNNNYNFLRYRILAKHEDKKNRKRIRNVIYIQICSTQKKCL